jgi:hypothetical protein
MKLCSFRLNGKGRMESSERRGESDASVAGTGLESIARRGVSEAGEIAKQAAVSAKLDAITPARHRTPGRFSASVTTTKSIGSRPSVKAAHPSVSCAYRDTG